MNEISMFFIMLGCWLFGIASAYIFERFMKGDDEFMSRKLAFDGKGYLEGRLKEAGKST